MNFNENDLWRDKTEVLNLRLSNLPSAKVLLKLEFDTEDQVLSSFNIRFGVDLKVDEVLCISFERWRLTERFCELSCIVNFSRYQVIQGILLHTDPEELL